MDEHLYKLLYDFTCGGTSLPALTGTKHEMRVTILVAALISNETVCSQSDPSDLVDAAIAYNKLIEERLGLYQQNQMNNLEHLFNNETASNDV